MSSLTEAIINIFMELKKPCFKKVKEGMTIISHQMEAINKEMQIIKKNQKEILELKSTIIENLKVH